MKPPEVVPTLREYQKQRLRRMLERLLPVLLKRKKPPVVH